MRRTLAVCLFTIATFTWAVAQNPGSTNPGSTTPGATPSQTQSGSTGATQSQSGATSGSQTPMSDAPITQGCLGGSNGGYTLTDNAGTTYNLKFPANANVSVLSSHVGESVAVMGDIQGSGKTGQTINVSRIGKGTTTCSSGTSAQPQTQTPKP
ncbi:MAG TPA: hypothetical protein VN577_20500 [Terriglobales bacterium]|nr:hypothetical protein [Terriglobales bacterium]